MSYGLGLPCECCDVCQLCEGSAAPEDDFDWTWQPDGAAAGSTYDYSTDANASQDMPVGMASAVGTGGNVGDLWDALYDYSTADGACFWNDVLNAVFLTGVPDVPSGLVTLYNNPQVWFYPRTGTFELWAHFETTFWVEAGGVGGVLHGGAKVADDYRIPFDCDGYEIEIPLTFEVETVSPADFSAHVTVPTSVFIRATPA